MKSKLFIVFAILSISVYGIDANAQENKVVNGIITTAKNFPLNKVKVTSSKSGEVAFTDSLGRFNLNSFNKDVLTFAAAGFKSKKIKVGTTNTYIIDLVFNYNKDNFKAAVSYGHISEEDLLKAVRSVKLKNQKDYSKYNSIYDLISAEIYKVRVVPPNVYNKSLRSFNLSPQVLYVVDGKAVANISYVNPVDVAKIEFVDDVGATAWGVQGANGVLKITLK